MKSCLSSKWLQCCMIAIILALLLLLAPFVTASAAPREQAPIDPTTDATTIIEAKSLKAIALTEAKFLLGEGDRATSKTVAREKWMAAADAFARAGDQLGTADAYLRLADSYQMEAIFSRQKLKLAVEYYLKALTAGADVYEELIQKELPFDKATLQAAQTLYERGQAAYAAGDCRQALPLLDEARRLYRQAKLGSGEVRVLTIKAICQMEAENYLGSLSTLLEGLLIAQSLPLGEPLTERYLEGNERYVQGDFTGALTIYEEVLKIYEERNDVESMAETLLDLGSTHAQQGKYGEATAAYEQALTLFLALQERNTMSNTVVYVYADYNEAATRHNLGNLATIDGRYTEAITELDQAIALWQAIGEPANAVASLNSLGLALRGLGDYEQALTILQQAWEQQQRLPPDLVTEGDIRNNIGYVYYSQGNFQQALGEFDQALEIRRQLVEPQRSQKERETRNNIAAVYASLSRFDEALTTYQEVLDQLPANTPATFAASLRANMAAIYIDQGDYQQGIATYVKILPELAGRKMEPMRAAALQNLGVAYLRTGNWAEGEGYLLEAQAIFTATRDLASAAAIDNNLGLFYAQAGYPVTATTYLEKALIVWQAEKNEAAAAKTLGNLALITATGDDLAKAVAYAEEALQLSEAANIPTDQARVAIILGLLNLKREDYRAVVTYGEQALALAQRIDEPAAELGSYLVLATAHLLTDDIAAADQAIHAAMNRLESLQGSLTVAELKADYLNQLGGIYDLAVLIALANQQPDQAFLYTEQARARAFLDQLAGGHIDFRLGAQSALIEQEQVLRQRMASLQSKLSDEKAKPLDQQRTAAIDNWAKELEIARREQSRLRIELQASNPIYATLFSTAVLSLADVQQTLDESSTLIVYFLPDVAILDKPLAWVIDRQAAMLVGLDVTGIALHNQINFLRNLLQNPKQVAVAEANDLAADLYAELVAPLKPSIRQPNLLIVPHANLHYLPFAALWDDIDKHYLVEAYPITYVPSASAIPLLRAKQNPNQGRLLALGNPDGSLSSAATEVRQVAALFDSEPLIGKAATESQVVAQAAQADIIHLAAHGVYDALNPLYTHIELAADAANDGKLEVQEVYTLDLRATNLVVLSACETALGQQSRGDELVGLTRAFFQAGAPTVMTTLWQVDDAATGALMVKFYEQIQAGETPSAALRNAQLAVLTGDKWQLPYYWAAFSLNGDYRGGEE